MVAKPYHLSFWDPRHEPLVDMIDEVQATLYQSNTEWNGLTRLGLTQDEWEDFLSYAKEVNERAGVTIFHAFRHIQYAPTVTVRACYIYHIMRQGIHELPQSEWRGKLIQFLECKSNSIGQLELF